MANSEFDFIMDSEFNNTGDLIGLDMELNGGEMLGRLRKLSPFKRFQVLRKLTKKSIPSRGSRRDMEKHFKSLPVRVRRELARGKMRLGDWGIYSTKSVNSKTIKLFETQDDREVSISNVSNAKLAKNQVLMVSKITVRAGVVAAAIPGSPTPDEIKAIKFEGIEAFPALANGDWSLKSNKIQVVPDNTPMQKFNTQGDNTAKLGQYIIDNPRPLHDAVLLEFVVELGTMTGIPQDLFIRVDLEGTVTTP